MEREPQLLTTPREGTPDVVTDWAGLNAAIASLAAGEGPVAIDAERASGFRYGQRAYLIQLRRAGAGTWLIDPIGFNDLDELGRAISDAEWIIHSAHQDLPCLRELGLIPRRIFDTELAGRILGRPKVGLGALVESELGFTLEKGHSAADWSTRPLPQSWLDYAALDVELLIELREHLLGELTACGRNTWAEQEFRAIAAAPPPPPRVDPWRRTSGMHKLRKPRQLAMVRELWTTRDEIAQRRDVSPGRIVNDEVLVTIATSPPSSKEAMSDLPIFRRRGTARWIPELWAALQQALSLPDAELPPVHLPVTGPPPQRVWKEKDPQAALRFSAIRAVVLASAEVTGMPPEVLVNPAAIRDLAWQPPEPIDEDTVAARLAASGVRDWQVGILLTELTAALADPQPVVESSDEVC